MYVQLVLHGDIMKKFIRHAGSIQWDIIACNVGLHCVLKTARTVMTIMSGY